MEGIETKVCTKCEKEKEISEFYKKKYAKDGLSYTCKLCNGQYHKLRKIKIREKNKIDRINIEFKICCTCKEEKDINGFNRNITEQDGFSRSCKKCCKESNRQYRLRNRERNVNKYTELKICNKCGIEKASGEFYKNATTKDGLFRECIDCCKEYYYSNHSNFSIYWKKYREGNREVKGERDKKYREENEDRCRANGRAWYMRNRDRILESRKTEKVIYSTYYDNLTIEESPIQDEEGFLMCKCSYCKEYFYPTSSEARNRIFALISDKRAGESRLYCSDKCKEDCDVYNAQSVPKSLRNVTKQARCNQNRVREILLDIQFDEFGYNWCEKCGDVFKPEDLYFHHNIPIGDDPTEYDNAAHYMICCKGHHEHKGCLGNKYE